MGGVLSYFLGDLSVDDVFRRVIVQQYFLDPFYFSIESTLGANYLGLDALMWILDLFYV